MITKPQKQNYEPCKMVITNTFDVSFINIGRGTFVHINANGQAVEVRMDDDGNVGVCISGGVSVATFAEIYGY